MAKITLRLMIPLLAIAPIPGWGAEDPVTAPAGWWTFDPADVSGDTVWDRAGSAHGQLGEGTRLVAGRIGQAVHIGERIGAVVCHGAPELGQEFTISAWFRCQSLIAQQHSIYAGDVKGCHYLRVNADGRLALGQADMRILASSTGQVKAGRWTHLAATWRSDGSYRFYIDGATAGSGRVEASTPFAQAQNASFGQVTAGLRRRTMDGELDELQVYATVLGDAAIANLASGASPPVSRATARPAAPATLRLRARAEDHWFSAGGPVEFTVEEGAAVPSGLSALTGTVADRSGVVVATVEVDAATLRTSGWSWTPAAPGWYEIAFVMTVDGSRIPVTTGYNYQKGSGGAVELRRDRLDVAVVPPLPPGRRPQFGFSYHTSGEPEVRLAQRLGFGFARISCLPWGADSVDESGGIELQRGVYHWEKFDPHIERLKRRGFTDLALQVMYTPRWASPHPEDGAVDICCIGRHVYAPTRMEYLQEFLAAAVRRYGADVHTWEIWNEPHLPGGSVFWKDTPKAYVDMLQAAYATLKKEQPDCEIWIGGMGGRRYLPFYKAFRKLGGAPFDRLAIHGSWPELAGFRAIESQFNAPSVPWLSSEWHAILLEANKELPSELLLARRLVLDACHHLQSGCERLAAFSMEEGEEFEKEMLPIAAGEGRFAQSYGLFRTRPRNEPRLAAVAMRTLIGLVREHLTFGGLADLDHGLRSAWFADVHGTLTVVWGDNTAPVELPQALIAGFTSPGVSVWTVDGAQIPTATPPALAPGDLLFVRDLPKELLAALPASTRPIRPDLHVARASGPVPRGMRSGTPLLDDAAQLLPEARPQWNVAGWRYVPVQAAERPVGLAARFAVALGVHGLDVVVEVDDPVFHQPGILTSLWNGDSVQFAIDSDGLGAWRNQTEFLLAQRPLERWFVKTQVPSFDGDLPQRWSPAWRPVAHARSRIEARPGGLRYTARIETSELYPLAYDAESTVPLRFSVLVNNSDGGGRGGWLEWGGGIGGNKEPEQYGLLMMP